MVSINTEEMLDFSPEVSSLLDIFSVLEFIGQESDWTEGRRSIDL